MRQNNRHNATFNAIGTTTRNGLKAGRYGFLADMRLKLHRKWCSFVHGYVCAHGGKATPEKLRHYNRLMLRGSRLFRSETRHYTVTHYGTEYMMSIMNPYCVITRQGEVVGIMPLESGYVLAYRYCVRKSGFVND